MVKERIIMQATGFFSLYGIKNITMDALASSLGISKRTIYEHFKNKEEVLKNCILASRESRKREVIKIMRQSENVMAGCLQLINHYKCTRLPTDLFWIDIYKYYPEVYQSLQESIEKSNMYFKQLLEKGMQDKYIRENIDVEEALCVLDVATCIITYRDYPVRISLSRTDLIYNIMVNMLRGISTVKGIEVIDAYIANSPHSTN